jgi:hypothetical protein
MFIDFIQLHIFHTRYHSHVVTSGDLWRCIESSCACTRIGQRSCSLSGVCNTLGVFPITLMIPLPSSGHLSSRFIVTPSAPPLSFYLSHKPRNENKPTRNDGKDDRDVSDGSPAIALSLKWPNSINGLCHNTLSRGLS